MSQYVLSPPTMHSRPREGSEPRAALCCAMLCRAMLQRAVPCCTASYRAMPCYAMLHRAMRCHAAPCRAGATPQEGTREHRTGLVGLWQRVTEAPRLLPSGSGGHGAWPVPPPLLGTGEDSYPLHCKSH